MIDTKRQRNHEEGEGMFVKTRMKVILFICLFAFSAPTFAQAQKGDEDEVRTKDMFEIFRNKRPQGGTQLKMQPGRQTNQSGKNPIATGRKRTKSEPQTAVALPSESQPQYQKVTAQLPVAGQVIGITVWRLRPSQDADAPEVKQKSLVQKKDDNRYSVHKDEMIDLTAERAVSNEPMPNDSMVQLSVEVPATGYLYVLDREQYNDGTFGEPTLIFPTKRINNGTNQVAPGKVISIPDAGDKPPFLTLERSSEKHTGEELTFVVTPAPIPELSNFADYGAVKEDVFKHLQQWAAQTGRIELANGKGKTQTVEEAQAARKSTKDDTKSLKHDAPLPQTIYRVARKEGEPMMVSLTLKIAPQGAK